MEIADSGYFPRREPGEFPAASTSKGLASRLKTAVGLDGILGEQAEVVGSPQSKEAEGEAPAYDPLRDGPLRYCGYANELGCVSLLQPSDALRCCGCRGAGSVFAV